MCSKMGFYRYPVFKDCGALTSLTIADGVQYIPHSAFARCSQLLGEIRIPNSVRRIDDYAFHGCNNIESLVLPNEECTIGRYAFEDCSSLTTLDIPEAITAIGDYAFFSCASLTHATIPDTVNTIGDFAFAFCSGLTSITFGLHVAQIGQHTLRGCNSLENIYIKALIPPSIDPLAYENLPPHVIVHVQSEVLERYRSAEHWQPFHITDQNNSNQS